MNISTYITPEIVILIMFIRNIYLNYRVGKIRNYQQYLYTLCKTYGVFDKLRQNRTNEKIRNRNIDPKTGEILESIVHGN